MDTNPNQAELITDPSRLIDRQKPEWAWFLEYDESYFPTNIPFMEYWEIKWRAEPGGLKGLETFSK